MADDLADAPLPAPPAPQEPVRNTRDAIQKVGRQIRHERALMPWMLAYAEWLMLECLERPKIAQRQARARGLARAPLSPNQLRLLEQRPDFVEYCDQLAKGPLEAARAKFQSAFPTYVEAHRKALDIAVENQDVGNIARLAEPVLDRVFPKKAEATAAAAVQIVLAPSQIAGVRAYVAPDVAVEAEDATADSEPAPEAG